MTNYVTTHIFIDWPLQDTLYLYKKYEDNDQKFSFRKVLLYTNFIKKIEQTSPLSNINFYHATFWLSWYYFPKRKEIKSESDLPGYISFDTRWICPRLLIEELISQNSNLKFNIKWYSENYTKWEIIWRNWKIVFEDYKENNYQFCNKTVTR